jgi:hypothetical protein
MIREQGLVLRASQHPSGKIVEPVTGLLLGLEKKLATKTTEQGRTSLE